MILIAGGSGFLGINMARCLAERGESVVLMQRHPMEPHPLLEQYWGKEVRQALGDLLDLSSILEIVKEHKINSIVKAAAEARGWKDVVGLKAVLDPRGWHVRGRFETEVVGAVNCLEATQLMDLRRMVFIASVDNYRGFPGQPEVFEEDAYLPPVAYSPDGNCKRAADLIGFLYAKGYGISYVSVRLGSNFGIGCTHAVVNDMIHSALNNEPLDLSGIPANRRTHCVYAKDSAQATSALLMADRPLSHHIYNVSSGSNPTMQEIADAVTDVIPGARITLGPPSDIKAHNMVDRSLRMDRIKEEVGFVPKSVREGIQAYVTYLRTGEY